MVTVMGGRIYALVSRYKEVRQNLQEYRENEGGVYRLIERRVLNA